MIATSAELHVQPCTDHALVCVKSKNGRHNYALVFVETENGRHNTHPGMLTRMKTLQSSAGLSTPQPRVHTHPESFQVPSLLHFRNNFVCNHRCRLIVAVASSCHAIATMPLAGAMHKSGMGYELHAHHQEVLYLHSCHCDDHCAVTLLNKTPCCFGPSV